MSKEKFTFIDLFAGCGGLSEGFLASNLKVNFILDTF
jgi:site-specific DNA-cytosine methylase